MTVAFEHNMIGKVARIGVLYDFYAALLTSRQRDMVELHYFDDWSLAEIAAHFDISRQAVHDNLRRAEEQLEGYESALTLLAQHAVLTDRVADVAKAWAAIRDVIPASARAEMDAAVQSLMVDFTPARGEDDV